VALAHCSAAGRGEVLGARVAEIGLPGLQVVPVGRDFDAAGIDRNQLLAEPAAASLD
jgi:hypothetical protein